MKAQKHTNFIHRFQFKEDKSKPGRIVWHTKVGDVYISRIIIEPGVTLGNTYHKDTRVMFYVGRGLVSATFEHVHTKKREEVVLTPEKEVIHVPEYVASTLKNIGKGPAVVVSFSNKSLQSDDIFEYRLL